MAVAPQLAAASSGAPLPAANEKARQLLYTLLTDEQAEVVNEQHYIPVIASDGSPWRISLSNAVGNCLCLDDNNIYCAHLAPLERGPYYRHAPLGDHYIAQLLTIQADADAFRRIALLYSYGGRGFIPWKREMAW